MRTIVLRVNDNKALKTLRALESQHAISIIDEKYLDTPSVPGSPMSVTEFRNWIRSAEDAPTVSLNEAKEKWAAQRDRLLRSAR